MEKVWKKHLNQAMIDVYIELRQRYSKEEADSFFVDKINKMESVKVISSKSLYSASMKAMKEYNQTNTIF